MKKGMLMVAGLVLAACMTLQVSGPGDAHAAFTQIMAKA